ncbi:formyltransferase family protein [Streptomyces xanthochromogenes]|uniref:formyltransferase family protein n=1 Tax=Streptomyces xanthochromogenes TaxID=67384 RepID=UPI0037AFBB6F
METSGRPVKCSIPTRYQSHAGLYTPIAVKPHRRVTMKLYLSGKGAFAAAMADALIGGGHQVVGVTSPACRAGRDESQGVAAWDRSRTWAVRHEVPWRPSDELRAHVVPDGTEILLAAHSHAFLGRATRARASVAALGYHPSLLPLHRGRDAVRWTIRDGDRVTGGSVYHLTERTDCGPIAAQEHVIVPPSSTAQSLWREYLAPMGLSLVGFVHVQRFWLRFRALSLIWG